MDEFILVDRNWIKRDKISFISDIVVSKGNIYFMIIVDGEKIDFSKTIKKYYSEEWDNRLSWLNYSNKIVNKVRATKNEIINGLKPEEQDLFDNIEA